MPTSHILTAFVLILTWRRMWILDSVVLCFTVSCMTWLHKQSFIHNQNFIPTQNNTRTRVSPTVSYQYLSHSVCKYIDGYIDEPRLIALPCVSLAHAAPFRQFAQWFLRNRGKSNLLDRRNAVWQRGTVRFNPQSRRPCDVWAALLSRLWNSEQTEWLSH